jgi:hypothetical protein
LLQRYGPGPTEEHIRKISETYNYCSLVDTNFKNPLCIQTKHNHQRESYLQSVDYLRKEI